MSKRKEHRLDAYERRAKILALIFNNPMATADIKESTGISMQALSNDLHILKTNKYIVRNGDKNAINARGDSRRVTLWESVQKLSSKELEDVAYVRGGDDAESDIPDFQESLLLMMGYNTKPKPKGRFIDNADFHPTPTRTAKHQVHIGNVWDQIMDMAL